MSSLWQQSDPKIASARIPRSRRLLAQSVAVSLRDVSCAFLGEYTMAGTAASNSHPDS